jgi:hypothetical protein
MNDVASPEVLSTRTVEPSHPDYNLCQIYSDLLQECQPLCNTTMPPRTLLGRVLTLQQPSELPP